MSDVLPDDPVSLIWINHNICILIFNENARKINILLKQNQCMPEICYAGWGPIDQFGEIPLLFLILGRQMLRIPPPPLIRDIVMTSKNIPLFLEIQNPHGYHSMLHLKTQSCGCMCVNIRWQSDTSLPGLLAHALPVLNHDQTNHYTKLMVHWCIATVA